MSGGEVATTASKRPRARAARFDPAFSLQLFRSLLSTVLVLILNVG